MTREFLKELGIEDAEVVKKILDTAMTDIGTAKKTVSEELQPQIETLGKQLKERDEQLETLKGVDVDGMKAEIEKLQKENQTAIEEANKEVMSLKKSNAIKDSLHNAKARDIEMAMKLLEPDKIEFDKNGNLKGLDEQLEALKTNEFSKTLFGEPEITVTGLKPVEGSTKPSLNKKPSEMTYAELADYMAANPGVDISSLE